MEFSMRIAMLMAAACTAGAMLASAAAAMPAKKQDTEKVICRTIDELGSRLASKRVCLTRSQWRQQQEMQRQNLDKAQRSRTGPDIG
jgi:Flp pilus assembly protein TadB